MKAYKQNHFPTLNAALESEGLEETWDISYGGLKYGETFSYTYDDGTRYGLFVSIYRFEDGLYERPISYSR